jgi:hypothetical protein
MKIAEPRPGTIGPVVYSITTKCTYARAGFQRASLSALNGGVAPQPMWTKRL